MDGVQCRCTRGDGCPDLTYATVLMRANSCRVLMHAVQCAVYCVCVRDVGLSCAIVNSLVVAAECIECGGMWGGLVVVAVLALMEKHSTWVVARQIVVFARMECGMIVCREVVVLTDRVGCAVASVHSPMSSTLPSSTTATSVRACVCNTTPMVLWQALHRYRCPRNGFV